VVATTTISKHLASVLFALSVVSGVFVSVLRPNSARANYASPPSSILICGIADHPCVTYTVSYHEPTETYGNLSGEGVTDYEKKSISIASSKDRFENVRALEHEVYHAVLHERGIRDSETWDIHSWIYLSEGPFTMVLHDNPEFVHYVMTGYRSPEP
jgi:hypothetical protein